MRIHATRVLPSAVLHLPQCVLLIDELAEHGDVALGLDRRRPHRQFPLQRLQHGRRELRDLLGVPQAGPVVLQQDEGGVQRQTDLQWEGRRRRNGRFLIEFGAFGLASESCISARDLAKSKIWLTSSISVVSPVVMKTSMGSMPLSRKSTAIWLTS